MGGFLEEIGNRSNIFWGVGGGRCGVDKKGEKNENGIQWSPEALDRSEMIRALPGDAFSWFLMKILSINKEKSKNIKLFLPSPPRHPLSSRFFRVFPGSC